MNTNSAIDVHSQLSATYAHWPFEAGTLMNPAMLAVIRREEGRFEVAEVIVPGMITAPPGCNYAATVDAIEVLP
jgi:hypothetical protein